MTYCEDKMYICLLSDEGDGIFDRCMTKARKGERLYIVNPRNLRD